MVADFTCLMMNISHKHAEPAFVICKYFCRWHCMTLIRVEFNATSPGSSPLVMALAAGVRKMGAINF